MALRRAGASRPIEDIPGIGEVEQRSLHALSIATIDELHSAYRASPSAFDFVLPGVDLEHLFYEVPVDKTFAPGGPPPPPPRGFGAAPPPGSSLPHTIPVEWFGEYLARSDRRPDFPPRLAGPPPGGTPPPGGPGDGDLSGQVEPAIVNLIPQMKAVRNQGLRYTCTAFAVGALMEFHLACDSLGPQFIYWKAKETDGSPNSPGTWISNVMHQMVMGGAAREVTWSYHLDPIPGNEGQGLPPQAAVQEAPAYQLGSEESVAPRTGTFGVSSELVMRRLALGVPVAISVVSPPDLWQHDAQVLDTGIFTMPLPGTAANQAHSVCAVGYGHDDDFAGGGYIIFRNSWGTEYYRHSPFGPGYGLLPTAYLDEWGLEAYSCQVPQ